MSVYMTEEEQIEAIKKWWQRYSTLITVVLSVILLTISGYKYWNYRTEKVNAAASTAFEKMLVAYTNKNQKAVQSYATALINDFDNTPYATIAELTLAKMFVQTEEYDKAIKYLQQAAANSKNKAFQQVADIRIARLLIAKKEYKQALTALEVMSDNAYAPLVNELKGDIYTHLGDFNKALTAYSQAIDETKNLGMGNLFLELKKNELATVSHSDSATSKNAQTV